MTRSRLHAVRYHSAITAYLERKGYRDLRVLDAFSGTVQDPDLPTVEYREAMLNGFGERELPERFAGEDYQVLVVAKRSPPASPRSCPALCRPRRLRRRRLRTATPAGPSTCPVRSC